MWKFCCACLALALFWGTQAQAHFGMVIPSTPTVTDKKESPLKLDIAFAHPMELQGMPMAEPKAFTVTHDGTTEDLDLQLTLGLLLQDLLPLLETLVDGGFGKGDRGHPDRLGTT